MALDTREKRASVLGVARPWYRTKFPGAVDAAWRAASGNIYAGISIGAPSVVQPTPASRIANVQAESRIVAVPAEGRIAHVPAEDRTSLI